MSTVVWEGGLNLYDRDSQIFSLYAFKKRRKEIWRILRSNGRVLIDFWKQSKIISLFRGVARK